MPGVGPADPTNDLRQGQVSTFTGTWSQTAPTAAGAIIAMTTIDPADNISFWTLGEYDANTSSLTWYMRIGKFNFGGGGASPTPTATATPASCSWVAGPSMPSVGTRMVGVFFPANGKFYAMGGRSSE